MHDSLPPIIDLALRLRGGELSRVRFDEPEVFGACTCAADAPVPVVAAQQALQEQLKDLGLPGDVWTASKAGHLAITPQELGTLLVVVQNVTAREFRQAAFDGRLADEQREMVAAVRHRLFARPWKWWVDAGLLRDRLLRSPVGSRVLTFWAFFMSSEAVRCMLLELERSLTGGAVDARNEQCTNAFMLVASVYWARALWRCEHEPVAAVTEMLVFFAVTVTTCSALVLFHPTPMPPPQGFFWVLGAVILLSRFTWWTLLGIIGALAVAVSIA